MQTNNGSIYVRIDNGYELGELHDVLDTTTTSSYGDLLVKSGSVWTNSNQLTGSYGLTGSLNATSFTGSLFGTASFASTASFVSPTTTNAFIQNGNSFGTTALLGTNDNQSLALETSGSVRMFISSSGDVGIGTITPSDKLSISAGNILIDNGRRLKWVDGSFIEGAGASSIMTFRSLGNYHFNGGNVGIGTSTPNAKLDVSGSAIITGSLTSTTTTLLNTISGNTAVGLSTDTSTARLQVRGTGATSATTTLLLQNSSLTNLLTVRDDGSSTLIGRLNITPTTSTTSSLVVTGPTLMSGSFNTISGSVLTVVGSGSAQPVFTVQGSQGELFSVTDSLSGSLFSVNDISGLPIVEVFSDGTTLIGNYLDPMLITTTKNTLTNSGSFTIYSLPTASYDTAFFDYSIKSGSNARAGQIMAIQSGSFVNYTETTTMDFGSTSGVSLGVFVSGSNMVLTGSAATTAWVIKTIVRSL